MLLSPEYSSTSRAGQDKASTDFYHLFDRDRGRRGQRPRRWHRGGKAEAPKQHTHARVRAAAAASGGRARGGGGEETAGGGRGRRINNRGGLRVARG